MTFFAAAADRPANFLAVLAAFAVVVGSVVLAQWLIRRGKHRPGESTDLEFYGQPPPPPPRDQLWPVHRLRQALVGLGILSAGVLMVLSIRAIREGPWWFAVGGLIIALAAFVLHRVYRDRIYRWVYGRAPDQMGPGLMPPTRPAPKADGAGGSARRRGR